MEGELVVSMDVEVSKVVEEGVVEGLELSSSDEELDAVVEEATSSRVKRHWIGEK